MSRKIVFFDIDGTMYSPATGITEKTRQAIRLLKERGHIPVICTGRPKASVFPELLELGFDTLIAGAGTYVEHEGQVLCDQRLSKEELETTTALLLKANALVLYEGPKYLFYHTRSQDEEAFKILSYLKEKFPARFQQIQMAEDAVNKITVYIRDEEKFAAVEEALLDIYQIIRYEGRPYAEMVPKGFSKASGIRFLIERLGIPLADTYAFGDGPNDLEMLQYVNYGIAMGNAEQVVLDIARYRTRTIAEDGVYYGLKEFGLIE